MRMFGFIFRSIKSDLCVKSLQDLLFSTRFTLFNISWATTVLLREKINKFMQDKPTHSMYDLHIPPPPPPLFLHDFLSFM